MRRIKISSLFIIFTLLTTLLMAQGPRGGGGNLPSEGNRPTGGEVTLPTFTVPEIQVTVPAINTDNLNLESLNLSQSLEDFTMPEDWSDFQLPQDIPTSEDLQAMWDSLPYDFDFEDIDFSMESSETASAAIVGFASTYLGAGVSPLYAGVVDSSQSVENPEVQQTMNTIISQFPSDIQAMLASAENLSGISYWAVLSDGVGVVYTGDCNSANCSSSMDSVQLQVTSGSLGAYALYRSTNATTQQDALNLLYASYPHLAQMTLEATSSDYGFAFIGTEVNMSAGQLTVYYAGVMPTGDQSIVYAAAGIGDVYVQLMLQ